MLKLNKITFDRTPRIPGLRSGDLSEMDCDNPPVALKDWNVIVRAQAIFLVSPRGWINASQRPADRDPKGPVTIHEIPRASAFLHWSGDEADLEAVTKGAKYETGPLGPKPPAIEPTRSILAQVPPSQLGDA